MTSPSDKDFDNPLNEHGMWYLHMMEAILTCRRHNEDQRFGQLLFNALASQDGRKEGYDEDFHRRLFYIEDEALFAALDRFLEQVDLQKEEADTRT